ncbi:hypothetical protein [Methylococcus sp. Mc7]|uniref:hypothetical protein n=1 Tax=Methylococcus sp. Mc7 TaxID=2860258 RepID=UPI001C52D151|nr:hypothetical protein [Methylococcus sp. Mc7]QXP85670.1 hypothetical protein KW115_08195 [Methylococcus sp. Mc7]
MSGVHSKAREVCGLLASEMAGRALSSGDTTEAAKHEGLKEGMFISTFMVFSRSLPGSTRSLSFLTGPVRRSRSAGPYGSQATTAVSSRTSSKWMMISSVICDRGHGHQS